MSTIKRKPFLTGPGSHLLLTSDPIAFIRQSEEFFQASGLAPERVLASPLLVTPLPVARKNASGGVERWGSDVDPGFLWHPLMWLPPHLALRYRYRVIDDEHGGTAEDSEVESDAVWSIRVALELVHSGLYNPDDGTWLDVLAYHGLEADNPVDQARVEQWLAGGDDPVLDAIDLTPMVRNDADPEWALRAAAQLVEVLVPAQWSLSASGIIAATTAQAEDANGDTDRLRALLRVMGPVSAHALHDVPADPETGIDYIDLIGILTEDAEAADADLPYLLATFLEAVSEIEADYMTSVETVGETGPPALSA